MVYWQVQQRPAWSVHSCHKTLGASVFWAPIISAFSQAIQQSRASAVFAFSTGSTNCSLDCLAEPLYCCIHLWPIGHDFLVFDGLCCQKIFKSLRHHICSIASHNLLWQAMHSKDLVKVSDYGHRHSGLQNGYFWPMCTFIFTD